MRWLLVINALVCAWQVTEAIQCYSCLSSDRSGKFCRKISDGNLINCPDDSTWCNALVFIKNGKVNVNRGCGGSVSSWGFGQSECDIMDSRALLGVGVALYQCRGDACNNIEPAAEQTSSVNRDVLLTTKDNSVHASGSVFSQSKSDSASAQLLDEDDQESSYGKAPPPKKLVYAPPPPPTTTTEEVEYEEETEAPSYAPVRVTYAPTPAPYVEVKEEESYAPAPKYIPPPMTTRRYVPPPTTAYEVQEEEEEEQAYASPPTTTTTTKRRRPDYGGEEIKSEETHEERATRPPARRRSVFDRR